MLDPLNGLEQMFYDPYHTLCLSQYLRKFVAVIDQCLNLMVTLLSLATDWWHRLEGLNMNREEWLAILANRTINEISTRIDYTEEETSVKLSCGFPATQGKRKKVSASLIPPTASADFNAEIFVTPELSDKDEVAKAILPLLVAVATGDYKQGSTYRNAIRALGLNEGVSAWSSAIVANLPTYPHAEIQLPPVTKQTTRLIKVACLPCGYIARVSRSTLNAYGAPICPACSATFTESN